MLGKYFSPDEIDKLVEIGPEKIKEIYNKPAGCRCADCEDNRRMITNHMEHPFYANANKYREKERIGQIVKGAEKYPEPFNPASWTAKELLQHAMQENIDQGHYIYGLFEKIEALEMELQKALDGAEYWQTKAIAADKRANDLQNTMYETREF